MFDRFSDDARKLMGHSRQAAQAWNHDYIGTEHILLGLLSMRETTAHRILGALRVDPKRIRENVSHRLSHGTSMVTMGQLPFTPRAKRSLELALEEASNCGHNYIGSAHLLLGLIREREGFAAQALTDLGVKLEDVREEFLETVGGEPPRTVPSDRERPPGWVPWLVEEIERLKERVAELERRLNEE